MQMLWCSYQAAGICTLQQQKKCEASWTVARRMHVVAISCVLYIASSAHAPGLGYVVSTAEKLGRRYVDDAGVESVC
jgi:hypothetical protein